MRVLDLHGIKHSKAEDEIRKFLNFVELPCVIITGNSQQMRSIVASVVKEYGWKFYEKDSYNYGALVINEGNYE